MTTNDSAKQIELLEATRKKRAALEARLRKEPLRQIADDLGVSVSTVRTWIKEMTQTYLPQEQIEELRAMEADGLDTLEARANLMLEMCTIEAKQKQAEGKGVTYLIERMESIQEHILSIKKRRSQLVGLDMPVKVNHAVTVRTEFDQEVEELTTLLLNGGDLLSGPNDVDTGVEADHATSG